MKYVAPVAELVSVETVSVILTSGVTGGGVDCPTQTPEEEI